MMMKLNDEIRELISLHGLEEDIEHIIIPLPDSKGKKQRCFLLKRPFMRLQYQDGHFADYPLEEIIESIIRYPEVRITEAVQLLHEDMDAQIEEIFENEHKTGG